MPKTNKIRAELQYPRIEGKPDTVEVSLLDVRAADSIRIRYDFDRDGWSIQQASRFGFFSEETERDEDWQEVAFVQAWQRISCKDPSVVLGDDECGPLCPECSDE